MATPPCGADPMPDEHGRGALQRVEQQRQRGEALVAGAQHVGGADVARADVAHVAEPGGACQQVAERDRAEQIAERERDQRMSIEEDVHGRAQVPAELSSARRQGTGRPFPPQRRVRGRSRRQAPSAGAIDEVRPGRGCGSLAGSPVGKSIARMLRSVSRRGGPTHSSRVPSCRRIGPGQEQRLHGMILRRPTAARYGRVKRCLAGLIIGKVRVGAHLD